MIDVATRVVPAAVLRPTTRSVDASVLLARAVTPEPIRPGWAEALKMTHSVLPYDRLLSIDEWLEHAAAKPVIVPDTIVIDHGSVFVSHNFRASCRHLGITIQPAHLASGAEKPHIERYFNAVGSLFASSCPAPAATRTGVAVTSRGNPRGPCRHCGDRLHRERSRPAGVLLGPVQKFSPFYQYAGHDPLINGLSVPAVLVAVGTVAVLAAVGVAGFRRRDVAA